MSNQTKELTVLYKHNNRSEAISLMLYQRKGFKARLMVGMAGSVVVL